MLICNFRKVLVLGGALLLATTNAATEDFRTFAEIIAERESVALKGLQADLAKDHSQPFINDKFESVACWGYLSSVKWMLSPECEVKPDQDTMNCTLIRASRRGANAVVRWMLNQPAECLRPDQQSINRAYYMLSEDVCYKAPEDPLNRSMNMTIALLRPFVTVE